MPVRPFTAIAARPVLRPLRTRRVGLRLPTLYLGYPGLVRGYDSNSFEAFECGTSNDGTCGAFDAPIGSRVAIANAELRFPLWARSAAATSTGRFPWSWACSRIPAWRGSDRSGRAEYRARRAQAGREQGVVARVNVLGFASRRSTRAAARSSGPRVALAVQPHAGVLTLP